MGIFRRKTKDIVLKQDISGYLVFPFPLKKDFVMLGRKALVPEGTVLAFATKGKVLDFLPEGQHTLTPAYLPLANKKFKLNKIDKYGQSPDGFYGYAYFVNLKEVKNFAFGTYKKLRYKNELDGKFWARLEFAVDLQIADEKLFLKSLLKTLAFLKPNEAENIVESWLSEVVTDTLQKYAFRRAEFEKPRVFEMTELLGAKMLPSLKNVGLELLSISLLECDLSSPQKMPKNPLLAPVKQINPVFANETLQENIDEEIFEEFEENSFDKFEGFENQSTGLMDLDTFDEFEEQLDENVSNFDFKRQNIQLQNHESQNINKLEDIDHMKKSICPENLQSHYEPDYEAIEATRTKLEEEFLKTNQQVSSAEEDKPKKPRKPQRWSGWEDFLHRD